MEAIYFYSSVTNISSLKAIAATNTIPFSYCQRSLSILCLHLVKMTYPSPEEIVGLCEAAQYPVIPHDDDPGSKVSLLLGEGVLHRAASCPPLEGRPSSPCPRSTSSDARMVL